MNVPRWARPDWLPTLRIIAWPLLDEIRAEHQAAIEADDLAALLGAVDRACSELRGQPAEVDEAIIEVEGELADPPPDPLTSSGRSFEDDLAATDAANAPIHRHRQQVASKKEALWADRAALAKVQRQVDPLNGGVIGPDGHHYEPAALSEARAAAAAGEIPVRSGLNPKMPKVGVPEAAA
jgi:hypothetical protein